MRDTLASSAAGAARVSFLIDLAALPAPEAAVRRGVAEIASVGVGVTWAVGGEGQAKLAAEAGGEASDAAVVAAGAGPEARRQAARLAGSLSLTAVALPVDPAAPSARLRAAASGLWECTPNRVLSPERRSLWNHGRSAHLFRASDAAVLSGSSVVVVESNVVTDAKNCSRLVRDLRKLAAMSDEGELVLLPLGALIEEQAEATKGKPQRSILRAA